jgi:hypothetical protein
MKGKYKFIDFAGNVLLHKELIHDIKHVSYKSL